MLILFNKMELLPISFSIVYTSLKCLLCGVVHGLLLYIMNFSWIFNRWNIVLYKKKKEGCLERMRNSMEVVLMIFGKAREVAKYF